MHLTNYSFSHPKNYLYSKPVKGLKGCGVDYGFTFNGKEKDNETYGEGNAYDFGARIYDSRLGRFLSIDPFFKLNYSISTYNFSENSPIQFVDFNGLFKLDPRFKEQDYPALTNILKNLNNVVNNNPNLLNALKENGTFETNEDLYAILTYGTGPEVQVGKMPFTNGPLGTIFNQANGVTRIDPKLYGKPEATQKVSLNSRRVNKLESLYKKLNDPNISDAKRERIQKRYARVGFNITKTILHEAAHVGNNLRGKKMDGFLNSNREFSKGVETGDKFEKDAFQNKQGRESKEAIKNALFKY